MGSKIDLIRQYIAKECEFMDAPPEDTATYMRLQSFFAYKAIRIEQAWYAHINAGNNSREYRGEWSELDRKRREYHNEALSSLLGFDRSAEKFGLEPFYTGEKLTEEEIESHTNLDARKEMTDFFFDVANEIEDLTRDKYSRENPGDSFIERLKDQAYGVESKYGVVEPLREDDGDVKFKDDAGGYCIE